MPLATTYRPEYLWSSRSSSGELMAPKKIRYGCMTMPPIEELSLPDTIQFPSSLLWPWHCALALPSVCPGTGDWRHLNFVMRLLLLFLFQFSTQTMFPAPLLIPLSWDFRFCIPRYACACLCSNHSFRSPSSPLALGMIEEARVSVSHWSAKNELNIFNDVESLFILLEYCKDVQACWVRQVLCLFECFGR